MLNKNFFFFNIFIISWLPYSAAALFSEEVSMQNSIEHIVILMLENRSFDNVFGWLYTNQDQPKNYIPKHATDPYGGLDFINLIDYTNVLVDSNGETIHSSPPIKGTPSMTGSPLLNSPKFDPHEQFSYVTNQIFGIPAGFASMLGFLQDYASLWAEEQWPNALTDICAVMESYTPDQLPYLSGLAKHYAVSDCWFSSVPTQTNPNRAFFTMGTSEGQIINGLWGRNVFNSDTIWNRLFQKAPQTSWKIFWQSDMLPAIFPGSYTRNSYAALEQIPEIDSHFEKIDFFHEQARNGTLPDFCFIEPQWTLAGNFSAKSLFSFSELIVGLQGNDCHPPGDVRSAENLVANIYTSLISNTNAWQKTLLIITFDEHGGLFDHIVPPKTVAPDGNFQEGFTFDRLGIRVPTLFISPLIAKSTLLRPQDSSNLFDHTSFIATILKWQNIPTDEWQMGLRTKVAATFESVISEKNPRKDAAIVSNDVYYIKPNISVVQMGQPFHLKDKNNEYLIDTILDVNGIARAGAESNKIALSFAPGSGEITHGSFVQIKADISELEQSNYLSCNLFDIFNCFYEPNKHLPSQWWTIKSVDHPYLGAAIQYGDKVYLENHIYLDPLQLIPARLSAREGLFGKVLQTEPISYVNSNENYWIIESLDVN